MKEHTFKETKEAHLNPEQAKSLTKKSETVYAMVMGINLLLTLLECQVDLPET